MSDPSNSQSMPSSVHVGDIVGSGPDAYRPVAVGSWSLRSLASDQDQPRIRDLDLAERLGYQHTHHIRDLIKRLIRDGKLKDIKILRAARKTPTGRPGQEFWLTEAQALKVVAKSETATADELLDEMIEVFRLAIRGLLMPATATAANDRLSLYLLSERQPLARFMSTTLITEISRIYGYGHLAGNRPPRLIIGAIGRLYEAVFGEQIHAEMKARGQERKLYEFLTSDAHRLAQRDLAILETLARQSFSKAEFWSRVDAQFKGFALQGSLRLVS